MIRNAIHAVRSWCVTATVTLAIGAPFIVALVIVWEPRS